MNIILCIVGGILNVCAGVLFKRWALTANIIFLISGIILYIMDTTVWALLLKRGAQLSVGGALWSAISLIIACMAGVFLFGEKLSLIQYIGITLVCIGMILC